MSCNIHSSYNKTIVVSKKGENMKPEKEIQEADKTLSKLDAEDPYDEVVTGNMNYLYGIMNALYWILKQEDETY